MNNMFKTSAAIAALTLLLAGNAQAACSMNLSKVVVPKGHTVDLIVACDNGEAFSSIDWLRDTTSASGNIGFPLTGAAQTGPFGYRIWDKLGVGSYSYTMTGVNATGGGTTTVGPVSVTVTAPPVTTTTGACGNAQGQLTHNAPSGSLCLGGSASAVTTAASGYNWTCTGSDMGNTACQAPRGYNVASSATNGTISPAGTTLVVYRGTKAFTLTPTGGGSAVVASGAGQCGGVFSGASNTTFTTQPITADCAVGVNFTTVSGATCGTDQGTTMTTTPTTGRCAAGTASTVTTTTARYDWTCTGVGNPVPTASCYATRGYAVTAAAGANGSISPTSTTAAYNSSKAFTLTPNSGYAVDTATGCGGSLSGTTYTTAAITASCAVSATFIPTLSPTDPGSGLWNPPGYPNLLVADQMGINGAGTVNYLPGCINHSAPPDASWQGCAANDRYTGIPAGSSSEYTFQFLQGKILSIRFTGKNDGFPSNGSFILTGASGNNVYSSVSMWIVSDPTVTYAATSAVCKNTSGQQPGVLTWSSQCARTVGARFYVNVMVNDTAHCGQSGSQCQFQLSESTDSQ